MSHPYKDRPDYQFWKRAGGIETLSELDPVVRVGFKIGLNDCVVTAGSCFAQHVARKLSHSGFNFLVTEPGHPILPATLRTKHNYGVFSARYGNIYTARQLLQLLLRAWGKYEPVEDYWRLPNGSYVDPFRPQIQPGNFISVDELRNDRRQHFQAVRLAIKSMSVFVFTLGLTEAWFNTEDGSVYPLAPGVAGGEYDVDKHRFVNFSITQTIDDMQAAINFIRKRNPDVRIILTVSPVPLNATALDRHILVSTVYSKSVLRVAAETICENNKDIDYFPSYEIITSPHAGGRYFAQDKRSVTEEGVNHVMDIFLKHYSDRPIVSDLPSAKARQDEQDLHQKQMQELIQVLCDEEAIDNA